MMTFTRQESEFIATTAGKVTGDKLWLSTPGGQTAVNIRTYQPGDDAIQAAIFNEAAADLPRFKPATADDVGRRARALDFDPTTRLYAVADNQPVAYVAFQPTGRIGFPWCRKGYESAGEPLFQAALERLKVRGLKRVFAAYRTDWTAQREFFLAHGFEQVREMINFVLDQADMPTRPSRRANPLTPLRKEDIPAILEMAPEVLKVTSAQALEQHLFHNPYFTADALFVLRNRSDDVPLAIGILITNLTYADPMQVDPYMPCYRLGAFGTEGIPTKRVNGLFSFLAKDQRNVSPLALDLMGHATFQLEEAGVGSLAAQVPSDAPHLGRFYESYFRRQGSFPVFERSL
jgi:hypothetical protein